jgi:tRNA-splicing ligase RtcB
MSRGEAARSLNQRKIDDEYAAAGILVNVDGHVPIDESSTCYKRSKEVVGAVVGAGLATVEYTLWPLASLKGTEGASGRRENAPLGSRASIIDLSCCDQM